MSALTRRLEAAVRRPTAGLPFQVLITRSDAHELLTLAQHGEHALAESICAECGCCIPCEDDEPARCTHQPLCASCWPGLCWVCQAEAEAGAS